MPNPPRRRRAGGKPKEPLPGTPRQGQLFDPSTGAIPARKPSVKIVRPAITHPEIGRSRVEFPGHLEWGHIGVNRSEIHRGRKRISALNLDFPINGKMDLRIYRILLNQIIRSAKTVNEIRYEVSAETIDEHPNIEHLLHSAGFNRQQNYAGDRIRENLQYIYTLHSPFHKIPKRPKR